MGVDDHAIVIGITSYPGLTSLEGPLNDIDLFTTWLKKKHGGNLPSKNIKTCSSLRCLSKKFDPASWESIQDARPHSEDIGKLFRPFLEKGLQRKKAGRRLYIYASGHGFARSADSYKNFQDTALYTANADMFVGLHVAVTSYAEWLAMTAVFDEIVLIMDCCRIKNLIHRYIDPPLPNVNADPEKARKVRKFYAFGAPWGQAAKEKLFSDRENSVYGIFTLALLEALDKAKPNRLGNVNGEIIKKYIHNVIDEIAGDTKVSPPEIYLGNYSDLIWFTRKDSSSPFKPKVTVTLKKQLGNDVCLIKDGSLNTIDSLPFTNGRVTVELEPGLYKFSIEGTSREQIIELLNDDIEITI